MQSPGSFSLFFLLVSILLLSSSTAPFFVQSKIVLPDSLQGLNFASPPANTVIFLEILNDDDSETNSPRLSASENGETANYLLDVELNVRETFATVNFSTSALPPTVSTTGSGGSGSGSSTTGRSSGSGSGSGSGRGSGSGKGGSGRSTTGKKGDEEGKGRKTTGRRQDKNKNKNKEEEQDSDSPASTIQFSSLLLFSLLGLTQSFFFLLPSASTPQGRRLGTGSVSLLLFLLFFLLLAVSALGQPEGPVPPVRTIALRLKLPLDWGVKGESLPVFFELTGETTFVFIRPSAPPSTPSSAAPSSAPSSSSSSSAPPAASGSVPPSASVSSSASASTSTSTSVSLSASPSTPTSVSVAPSSSFLPSVSSSTSCLICEGSCVDPLTDNDNCGGCGTSCDSAQECTNGVCVGTGTLQFTLVWNKPGDADLCVVLPTNDSIWFDHKRADGGRLDVDDTTGTGPENIFWARDPTLGPPPPSGQYHVCVSPFAFNVSQFPVSGVVTIRNRGVVTRFSWTRTEVFTTLGECTPQLPSYITTVTYE